MSVKDACSFIGMINFYRDMFPHWSHLLAPLTQLTGKEKFLWSPEHQPVAFDSLKALIV